MSDNNPGCLTILFHVILVCATGGLWGVWLIVRHLLKNR